LAVRELEKEGISARLINLHTLKPLDREAIVKAARATGRILVVEEQNIHGGLAGAISEVLLEEGCGAVQFQRMGLQNTFAKGYGSYADLKEMNGLSKAHIMAAVKKMVGN
jgi:transketolase